MKYDASGQKPASANGFDPGARVVHIGGALSGVVSNTNLGTFQNEVLVSMPLGDACYYQTALTIVQPVANRRS